MISNTIAMSKTVLWVAKLQRQKFDFPCLRHLEVQEMYTHSANLVFGHWFDVVCGYESQPALSIKFRGKKQEKLRGLSLEKN